MTTFALQNYSMLSALKNAWTEQRVQHGSAGRAFYGPSPFEVPEGADVRLIGHHVLVFRFNYQSTEDVEDFDRAAAKGGSVVVRLGEKTRRIVQLTLRDDIRQFSPSEVMIDAASLAEEIAESPKEIVRAMKVNARVIESIIHSLPTEFVQEIKDAADTQAEAAALSAHG